MNLRLSCALLAATAAHAASLKSPIFEETFNVAHERLVLRDGAGLGGPGTGVSGKAGDRAYSAVPRSTEQEPNGPAAVATAAVAPESLSALTVSFWYYLDEQGPELQVPLNTAGFMLLLNQNGLEIRLEHSKEAPRQYVFSPGIQGPYAGWRDTGRWIFVAFSWARENNTLSVYQATPDKPVAFMRDMIRETPAKPTLPRVDLTRVPEVIGNTSPRRDRPLAGRMDNLRIFDRVVDRVELEGIRRADLANTGISFN